MNLADSYKLLLETSEGKDNSDKGIIGGNGFEFAFFNIIEARGLMEHCGNLSQIYCFNEPEEIIKELKASKDSDLLLRSEREGVLLAGALKTVVPTIEYGGYELLFEVLLLVLTDEHHFFPLIFYYGASGLAIGGFDVDWEGFEEYRNIFNYNPFKYPVQKIKSLIESLGLALLGVPKSDFYGVYRCDSGNFLMGLKQEDIILLEVGDSVPSSIKFIFDFL